MARRKTLLDELHEEIAANPVMNEAYQKELARLRLANQILEVRQVAGMSQQDLAERIGTKQSAIARMERGNYTGYTVSTLAKIAAAVGRHLEIGFTPIGRRRARREREARTARTAGRVFHRSTP
jgi:ribosome-binding protein aMBF1 (putative translation factor)